MQLEHAARHDHRRIQARFVDADVVVVLAVMVTQVLLCVDELRDYLGWDG